MTFCAIDTTVKSDTKDRLSLQLEIVQGQSQDQTAIVCLTSIITCQNSQHDASLALESVNIQPSFSPGKRQGPTILIQEHLHSNDYHSFWELPQQSNIFQRYQIRDV